MSIQDNLCYGQADDEAEHDSSWNKHAEHEIRAIDLADLSSVGVESDGTASEGPRLTIAREADSEQPNQAPQPTSFWHHGRREKACFRHFL